MRYPPTLLLAFSAMVQIVIAHAGLVAAEPSAAIDLTAYALEWSDEFDGTTLDTAKWQARTGERQGASRWVPSLVRVADGCLHLGIRLTADTRLRYDCGAVATRCGYDVKQTMFAMNAGYVEARCKLPRRLDADYWAAFWIMAGRVASEQTDTRLGHEIDIMESFNLGPGKHHACALHWGGYDRNHNKAHIDCGDQPALRDGAFHTFGLLWSTDAYTFYVDGIPVGRTDMLGLGRKGGGLVPSKGVCREPGYLLLSCEAAAWPGASHTWEADMPKDDEFIVDWVRAYGEKKPAK